MSEKGSEHGGRVSWQDFRDAGLLWWVNRELHLFGWAIAVEVDDEGVARDAYPMRCAFRGFSEDAEAEGFERLTEHLLARMPEVADDLGWSEEES